MKAIGITPGRPRSARLLERARPRLAEVSDGRGVLVQVLQVGVDGTDRELYLGQIGAAPPGEEVLIPGHESMGRVIEAGPAVDELAPGDLVVATVRRPAGSIYDQIGSYDMSTDAESPERGINLLHGFLCEAYVEHADYLVRMPDALRQVAVLMEPASVVEKGIRQAYEIQRRLRVWRPRRAAVMGAGTIGLLACMALRLRGLEVTAFARTPRPNVRAARAEEIGARYLSTREVSVAEAASAFGPFDLVLEATGYSPMAFEAAHALAKNGVLILASVTSGDLRTQVETDRLNMAFMAGNKVMLGTVSAHREDFEAAGADFARAELAWPGWLSRLLTHPVRGLEGYEELFATLLGAKDAIKVYTIVGEG
jgi:threonine dehydrogenase-like Zn-dependent dehydrogenase